MLFNQWQVLVLIRSYPISSNTYLIDLNHIGMIPTTFTNVRNILILFSKFNYYYLPNLFTNADFGYLYERLILYSYLHRYQLQFNKLFLHYTPTSILQHIVVSLPYTSYNMIVELFCRLALYFTFSHNKPLISFLLRFIVPIDIITNINYSIHYKYPYS